MYNNVSYDQNTNMLLEKKWDALICEFPRCKKKAIYMLSDDEDKNRMLYCKTHAAIEFIAKDGILKRLGYEKA